VRERQIKQDYKDVLREMRDSLRTPRPLAEAKAQNYDRTPYKEASVKLDKLGLMLVALAEGTSDNPKSDVDQARDLLLHIDRHLRDFG